MRTAEESSYLHRERWLVAVAVLILALTAAHFVLDGELLRETVEQYLRVHDPGLVASRSDGKLHAPGAYRIGMPALFRTVHRLLPHLSDPTLFGAVDTLCTCAALWLVYLLVADRFHVDPESRPSRGAAVALTLFFCATALVWLPQFARPETTPTAIYVAWSVLAVQRGRRWMMAGQLLLTLVQSTLRTDVPVCLGLGMLIAATAGGAELPGRGRLLLAGAWSLATGAAAQLYLQLVRFPHLTYDAQTRAFALPQNLHFHTGGNGLLALAPVWLTIVWGLRRVPGLLRGPGDRAALAAGAVYFPLWLAMGLLSEVRIYLPFLLVLSPLAARSAGRCMGWVRPEAELFGPQLSGSRAGER